MLRLLLDEHVSSQVAKGLRRRSPNFEVQNLIDWEGGRFLGLPDEAILQAASQQKLTLVTYDRKTIPPLLKDWVEWGRNHSGIIFVDEKTIPPSDLGSLIRVLQKITTETARWEWLNRIVFLRR